MNDNTPTDCQVRAHHNLMCVLPKSFQSKYELPNVNGTQHIKIQNKVYFKHKSLEYGK